MLRSLSTNNTYRTLFPFFLRLSHPNFVFSAFSFFGRSMAVKV